MYQQLINGARLSRAAMHSLAAVLVLALGTTAAVAVDCNNNGVDDAIDISSGTSQDCNHNGKPDECDIASGLLQDCNKNGVPDVCDVQAGTSQDLNGNEVPDECEPDCNDNGVPDSLDLTNGTSEDCNQNGLPDECDISLGFADDCNNNGVPDACDRFSGNSQDCNGNQQLDECEIAAGAALDCNNNIIPDECEVDCNNNDIPDSCDIALFTSADCNSNGVPDECDLASGGASDCNDNGLLDACESINPEEDCNLNSIPDVCEALVMTAQSAQLGPIGTGFPRSFTIPTPPASGGDVSLLFESIGDFAAPVEYIDVRLNGMLIGRVFEFDANDCPNTPNVDEIVITAGTFNNRPGGANAIILMTASAAVDPTPDLCTSYVRVHVFYQAVTAADGNGNGIPDECELGPCAADLAGDDGMVNVFDLFVLLSGWGSNAPGANLAAPFNVVDVFDLFVVLGQWGECE